MLYKLLELQLIIYVICTTTNCVNKSCYLACIAVSPQHFKHMFYSTESSSAQRHPVLSKMVISIIELCAIVLFM